MREPKFITAEQAISILPDGDEIRTFILLEPDWIFALGGDRIEFGQSREAVIDKIKESDMRVITWGLVRETGFGLMILNNSARSVSDCLGIATDKDRLDLLDPPNKTGGEE